MKELQKLIFLEVWYQTYLSQQCPYRSGVDRKRFYLERFYVEHVLPRRPV